jgi:hypothetical protein
MIGDAAGYNELCNSNIANVASSTKDCKDNFKDLIKARPKWKPMRLSG